MSNTKLSEIASELVQTKLREAIKTLAKSSTNDQIEITSVSPIKGDNPSCNIYRIAFTTNDESNTSSSSLIIKVAPQNLVRRTLTYSRPCFLREIFMHDEVLPYFREFEQTKGVNGDNGGFIEYPKCYQTMDLDQNECVLLEDLKGRGFTKSDQHSTEMTVDHVRLYLSTLAKFHAISFVLKEQEPEKFKQLTSNLTDIYMSKSSLVADAYYAAEAENFMKALSSPDDAHLYSKVKEFFAKGALNAGIDSVERELNESATVISYGDAYQSSMSFKYDSNGHPIGISLIDWQLSRHGSPMIDFIHFVFSCTTKEMRDIHYEDLLKTYHDHLTAHIRRLGSDPEKLFPYTMMLDHMNKFARYGLILTSTSTPIIFSPAGNKSNLDWDELSEKFMQSQEIPANLYKLTDEATIKLNKHFRDVAIDMIRLKYL